MHFKRLKLIESNKGAFGSESAILYGFYSSEDIDQDSLK